jgi:tetratricopeptide (TPR) repeat protein
VARNDACKAAMASDDPATLKAFLETYPNGTSATQVRIRLQNLEPQNAGTSQGWKAIVVLGLLIISVLVAALLITGAFIDNNSDMDTCRNASGDASLDACSRVINMHKYNTPIELANAYLNRGIVYFNQNLDQKAISDFSQAIILNPNDARAFDYRGFAYEKENDYARAALDYDKVTRISPQNAAAWNGLCWAQAIAGQLVQALKDCDESLRLRPNDVNALDSRGFTYLKLGRYDKAIADYDARLIIEPNNVYSLYGRGLAKLKKGDRAGGNADIAAAKTIDAKIADEFAGYGVN